MACRRHPRRCRAIPFTAMFSCVCMNVMRSRGEQQVEFLSFLPLGSEAKTVLRRVRALFMAFYLAIVWNFNEFQR